MWVHLPMANRSYIYGSYMYLGCELCASMQHRPIAELSIVRYSRSLIMQNVLIPYPNLLLFTTGAFNLT